MKDEPVTRLTQSDSTRTQAIAVVIVTHNRPETLRRVLEQLFGQPELIRVYVVNNAGSQETVRVLAEFASHPRVCVLSLPMNVGGAGGFHAGMKRAMEDKDWDWVVLQDDDAWPAEGAFARLSATYGGHASDAFAVAALVLHPDGRICEMNRPRRVPFTSFRGFMHVLARRGRMPLTNGELRQGPRPVDMSTFVGLFLTRSAFEKTGLPDARFFIYADDWEYTLRLRKKGVPLMHDPSVLYRHDHFSRTGEREPYNEIWKWYYACRNGLILMRRVLGPLAWPFQRYWIAQWRKECAKYPDPAKARKILDRATLAMTRRAEWPAHHELLAWIETL